MRKEEFNTENATSGHNEPRRAGQEEHRWHIETEVLRLAKFDRDSHSGRMEERSFARRLAQDDYPLRIVNLAEHLRRDFMRNPSIDLAFCQLKDEILIRDLE